MLKKARFLTCPTPAPKTRHSAGKAAGESKPEAYPWGYVEDFDELRTKLADFFSILLVERIHQQSVELNARVDCGYLSVVTH